MKHRVSEFAKRVAQQIEFAGFGPCAADGSVIQVQAFDSMKRYVVTPKLEVAVHCEKWSFPSMLTPTTLAVCKIIEDAFVKNGLDEPGANATIRVESPEIPYSLESRYLWLVDPEAMQRLVMTILFKKGKPMWATESLLDYHAEKDGELAVRVRALADTYTANTPEPDQGIVEILPEIIDTVESL